jgi:hypothetical protein
MSSEVSRLRGPFYSGAELTASLLLTRIQPYVSEVLCKAVRSVFPSQLERELRTALLRLLSEDSHFSPHGEGGSINLNSAPATRVVGMVSKNYERKTDDQSRNTDPRTGVYSTTSKRS